MSYRVFFLIPEKTTLKYCKFVAVWFLSLQTVSAARMAGVANMLTGQWGTLPCTSEQGRVLFLCLHCWLDLVYWLQQTDNTLQPVSFWMLCTVQCALTIVQCLECVLRGFSRRRPSETGKEDHRQHKTSRNAASRGAHHRIRKPSVPPEPQQCGVPSNHLLPLTFYFPTLFFPVSS